MIANTNKAIPPGEREPVELLKLIWGISIVVNLLFIFLLNLVIYIQAFVYLSVLVFGVLLVIYHPKSKVQNRLILGVLLVDCWFIQNTAYIPHRLPVVPFLLESILGVVAGLLGWYNWVSTVVLEEKEEKVLVFLIEVVICLLPVNLIGNLPTGTTEVYIVFITAYWFLLEAFLFLTKTKMKESISGRVGVVIPMFILPFYAMCGYYLLLASVTGYVYKKEGEGGGEGGEEPIVEAVKEEELPVSPSPPLIEKSPSPPPPPPIEEKKPIPTPQVPTPQPTPLPQFKMRIPKPKNPVYSSSSPSTTLIPRSNTPGTTGVLPVTQAAVVIGDRFKGFYS